MNKIRMSIAVVAGFAASVALGNAACGTGGKLPVGYEAQHAKQLWVTYRSFNKELERTGQFAEMGITNRCFFAANTINSLGTPYCEYPLIWKGFGNYDWSALDAQAGDLVKASPNARFMVMIDLNTPYWATHKFWLDSFTDITHAACDADWRKKTEKWMLDFIAYAEKKWGDRIGSYILSGGGTSEWYEYDRGRTSEKKDAAWVKWCKTRKLDYGATVPARPSLAKASFENLVYDPATEPEKVEYWKFHNSLSADALLGFAKAARKAIPKTKEIGAFFGYFLVSDAKQTSFAHLDYQRVYASPDIDFFIAPGSYNARAIGEGTGSQLVDGTALRYGKRFLHEIDFGPHDQNSWGRGLWKTLADDLAGNTREAAFAMSKNANYWWFDMWGGFYRNPAVRARIAALRKAQDNLPDAPSVSQVLLVADPDSIYYLNERNHAERAFGQAMRNALSKTGAPYDTCSFADLAAIDLAPYRMVVLNSTLLITPEREKLLKEKVFTRGRTVVWTYAPGLIDGKTLNPTNVARFAGVPYKTPGVSVTEMAEGLALRSLGEGGWNAVYAHDYKLYTTEKLAEIEARAGVHRYVDVCTPVYAKENFVAVHTKNGGDLTIRLPQKAEKVTDLLTGETMATDAAEFKASFVKPDTRLFKIDRQIPQPVVQPFRVQAKGRPILVVNGDNDHYFKQGCMQNFVPVEERVASAEGARRYLDALAAGGKVTHYFACPVGQRASYDSKACDPMWLAIDEAKARGEQPDEWPVNVKKMHDHGFDCYQVWCEYGRKKGISVWISQRMNDVHHVDRNWNMRTNRFWYEHPELHRAPDHDRTKGGPWTLHALDYSKPEVREFEFGIFKELVDRYDADGFELDFMRFWEYLTPGKEREQAPILTAFIRRCRGYANEKAKTRGHAILLSTRVPTDYAAASAFGFDPETWAREGLVDMIAVANFWAGVDFDFGFADWRAKIAAANPSVTVLPCACDNLSCSGAPAAIDGAGLAGWADNAYAAGADGIYFFNAAYYPDEVQRTIYERGFDAAVARSGARRYLPAFHDCVPKGVSDGRQVPIPVAKGGEVRIVVGTAPKTACEVVVVLDADAAPPRLALNGVEPTGAPVREERLGLFARDPRRMKSAWRIPFAASVAKSGTNVVSYTPTQAAANILWCELDVADASAVVPPSALSASSSAR